MNLGVVTHIEAVKNLNIPPSAQLITHPPSLMNIQTEVLHQDVNNLTGLLHQVVLADHNVDDLDHQYTCT